MLFFFQHVIRNQKQKKPQKSRRKKTGFSGISTDSLFVLAHWKKEQGINFTLAADFNKDVSEAFGVNYETFAFGMKGVAKRSAFVIDENGVILHTEVLENAGDMPDFDHIHAALK